MPARADHEHRGGLAEARLDDDGDVCGRDAGAEHDLVDLRGRAGLGDLVDAAAGADAVGVGPVAPGEVVVAGPAAERVVPEIAVQFVIAGAAGQAVVA